MRVAIVLPLDSHFGPDCAGSIDLCVYDYARCSRYRRSITILAPSVDRPFNGFNIIKYFSRRQLEKKKFVKKINPDIVVVHHDVWSARRIASRFPNIPVILIKHNSIRFDRSKFSKWRRMRRLRKLAGIVFVSKNDQMLFRQTWPQSGIRTHFVHNGLRMSEWEPMTKRRHTIMFAGRADENKGALVLARALRSALPQAPGWTAQLFLSAATVWPERVTQIREVLAPLGNRVEIRTDRPHAEIKMAFCKAAIAVTPTQTTEAFGRTALEAMAGGAALVTSSVGALPEVVGNCALTLDKADAPALKGAVLKLVRDSDLRAEFAAAGRRRAWHFFDLDHLVDKLDDFLEAYAYSSYE